MKIQTLEDAIAFAALSHKGQMDENGLPYITHPLRVMLRLHTDDERIVGVLHDVIEDCGVTCERLRALGYNENVVEALGYVSKLPEEKGNYEAFVDRIKHGPVLAIKVKLADLADNMDPNRQTASSEKNQHRLKRYSRAKGILEEALHKRV